MNDFSIQQGWQCPLCKRVYSPFTPCCFTCGGESVTTTSVRTDPCSTCQEFDCYDCEHKEVKENNNGKCQNN